MTVTFSDVSKWQGSVDWRAYCAGRDVAVIRAHTGYAVDPYFSADRAGAHANGIKMLGMYQYVAPGNYASQAHELCAAVGKLLPNEFLVADIEDSGIHDGAAAWRAWLPEVETFGKRRAWLYTGDYLADQFPPSVTAGRVRWLARYSTSAPGHPFDVWQESDHAAAPGISAPCDESRYAGTLAELEARTFGSAPTPPNPPAASSLLPYLAAAIRPAFEGA